MSHLLRLARRSVHSSTRPTVAAMYRAKREPINPNAPDFRAVPRVRSAAFTTSGRDYSSAQEAAQLQRDALMKVLFHRSKISSINYQYIQMMKSFADRKVPPEKLKLEMEALREEFSDDKDSTYFVFQVVQNLLSGSGFVAIALGRRIRRIRNWMTGKNDDSKDISEKACLRGLAYVIVFTFAFIGYVWREFITQKILEDGREVIAVVVALARNWVLLGSYDDLVDDEQSKEIDEEVETEGSNEKNEEEENEVKKEEEKNEVKKEEEKNEVEDVKKVNENEEKKD